VYLIAIPIVVTRFLAADSPILQWRLYAPLIKCGQHLLEVFCFGVVLSFCAHAAIETSLDSLWVQIFVGTLGILFLTASAHYLTWYKRHDGVLPFSKYLRPLLKLEMPRIAREPKRRFQ
jgi:hypothetical protein